MAQGLIPFQGSLLANAAGQLVGAMGLDGKEYLLASNVNTPAVASAAPAQLNGSLGSVTPSTIIATTTRIGAGSCVASAIIDSSGTPGNATQSVMRGRAAFAAAGSTVTITNSICTANASVFVQLQTGDATLTRVTVVPGAGSFVVTGNAPATGTTVFDYFIIQQ